MKKILIYHHLGIGDHIICNAIVRHYGETNDLVELICYAHNKSNIVRMFEDVENLSIISVSSDDEAQKYISKNSSNILKIGFDLQELYSSQMSFDEVFYKLANMDFDFRFSKFKLNRNPIKEEEVFSKLNPLNEKYIFVHDDPNRGFVIDKNRLQKKYNIIYNDMSFSIFDYLKIIENAEEIHFMQSSFKELLNSIVLDKPKLFQHNYVRGYGPYLNSKGLNPIIEVN